MGYYKDLRLAIITIGNADATLTSLTGSTNPTWYYGNHKGKELPIVTYVFLPGKEGTDSDKQTVRVRFVTWANPASGATYLDIAEDIRDRVEAIMTHTALNAQSVNTAPLNPSRRDIASPEDKGIVGLVLEIDFFNGE